MEVHIHMSSLCNTSCGDRKNQWINVQIILSPWID
jgi:hypothetical protein